MPVSVTMPRLGESVTEGTVTRWLKKEGDQVTADEPLLEVSTDKVDTEIPAPASGVLQSIKVGEDETVAVGAELAVIGDGAAGGDAGAGESAQPAAEAPDGQGGQGPAEAQAPAAEAPAAQAQDGQAQDAQAQAGQAQTAQPPTGRRRHPSRSRRSGTWQPTPRPAESVSRRTSSRHSRRRPRSQRRSKSSPPAQPKTANLSSRSRPRTMTTWHLTARVRRTSLRSCAGSRPSTAWSSRRSAAPVSAVASASRT
jgi:2-oxoglutarate dehydrogenase E2 component (dihydrolipoamide succinyltransferase)